jgi:hypothetical protein
LDDDDVSVISNSDSEEYDAAVEKVGISTNGQ